MEDIFYTYFLIGVVVVSFVLTPFGKKKASKSLSANEYFLVNQVMIIILAIIYAVYLFNYNKCDINCVKKMTNNEIIWSIGAAITGILGSIGLIMLVQMEDITFIMPNIQPTVLLLSAIIGYYIFNEDMGWYKIYGFIFIIIGALCINYDKLSKK